MAPHRSPQRIAASYRPIFAGLPQLRAVGAPSETSRGRVRRPALIWLVGIVGLLLAVGPVADGIPYAAAGGSQMIDRFQPHMTVDALTQTHSDLVALSAFSAGIKGELSSGELTSADAPLVVEFARQSDGIQARSSTLLDAVRNSRPDYQRLAAIRGLSFLPHVIAIAGIVLIVSATAILRTRRRGGRGAGALGIALACAILIVHPFASGLAANAGAANRLVRSFRPIMTHEQVVDLQTDFVTIVGAMGEIDRGVLDHRHTARVTPADARDAAAISAFRDRWQQVSSDFAGLIGVVNDDIGDFDRLAALNSLVGGGTLAFLPWVEVTVAIVVAVATLAAGIGRERRRPARAERRRVPNRGLRFGRRRDAHRCAPATLITKESVHGTY